VTGLIDHIVTTTGIESVYREAGDSRALRNLEQVRAIAFTYDRKAGGSPRQFVEEIARRRETPEEVEPSLLDETTNAVRILTIHGAKGLEFETVILPDLEFPGGGSKLDLFTVEEPPTLVLRNGLETLSGICRSSDNRPLKEIGSLRDKAELRRLFYVAVTRARSEIVFVTSHKAEKKGFGKFMHLLFPERLPAVEPSAEEPIAEAVATGPEPLAPCAVAQPADAVELLPRDEVAIARRGSANRAAGILLHRVLERWDGTSDAAPLIASLALEQAADERSIDLVRGRMAQIAGSEVFRRIMAAETIGREMPVAFIDASGVLVERRVDRLLRENGGDLVVDYKSGQPSPARIERDREQVALYCRLLGDMNGRPCRGLLWYIDAENDVAIDVM
jgi:ATP-dependent exoDNAse (exonuclease V) beta subunit